MSTKLKGTTYEALAGYLGNRPGRRTIGNNTTAELTGNGAVEVYLHHKLIATLHDGIVILRDAGYQTATTKERLNQLAPPRVLIYQRDCEWYIDTADVEGAPWTGTVALDRSGHVLVDSAGEAVVS
jgi:hypothetical protein